MEPCYKTLPLNYHPQQNEFIFDGIKFMSKFDSGNIFNVDKVDETTFDLYISPDCYGREDSYSYRTWFYFGVINLKHSQITLNICNMNNQLRMFKEGFKIVYRKLNLNEKIEKIESEYIFGEESKWKRLMNNYSEDKKQLRISFNFKFQESDKNGVLFSFCYPWSYTKNLKFLEYIQKSYEENSKKLFYYHSEILVYSKEKRIINLLTISSYDEILKDRPYTFCKNKPIIFISARVHPGETPSSYIMNGIIKILTSSDPRAEILRRHFVFKIIPIINVDGVYRGFYRHDTNALNMNRHYPNPSKSIQPELYAIKNLFLFYCHEFSVRYYLDLHSHVSSKGLFLFGNSLEFLQHVENQVLPQIFQINSEYFSMEYSVFSEKSMKSIERGDKFSKEGTGRVYFHKCTNLIHSYTMEASCFRGTEINRINSIPRIRDHKIDEISAKILVNLRKPYEFYEERSEYVNSEDIHHDIIFYTPYSYEKMGISILVSILDYEEKNPFTRISLTEYRNVKNIRSVIANKLVKEDEKFKKNLYFQNITRDIEDYKKFVPLSVIENEKCKLDRKNRVTRSTRHNETEINKNKTSSSKAKILIKTKSSINIVNLNTNSMTGKTLEPKSITKINTTNKLIVNPANDKFIKENLNTWTSQRGKSTAKKKLKKEKEIKYIVFPDIIKNKK